MKHLTISSLGLISVMLAACSQPPAPIALKGDRYYGKDATMQYAQVRQPQAPVFTPEYNVSSREVAVPVETMQIAELPEPVIEVAKVEVKPQAAAKPAFKTATYSAEPKQLAQPVVEPAAQEITLAPLPIETLTQEPQALKLNPMVKAAIEEEKEVASSSLETRSSNFIWPVEGPVVSRFGPKKNGLVNDGINIEASEGNPIWAAADGEVVYAGNELKGYGNMMIVRHANGWMTAYAHASDMLVAKGDKVGQGDLIGYVGKTGAVTKAQLHFGIREGKNPVDPETLLPRRVASAQ